MQEFQLLLLFVEMDNFHRLRRYERIENAQRLLRPVRNYVDPFNYFDDTNFYCNCRFTPAEVFEITRRIEVDVAPRGDRGRPIPTEQRVLLFLYFVSSDSFQRVCGHFPHVATASMCRMIKLVAIGLTRLREAIIHFPRDTLAEVARFREIANFPNVVGAIDCTHVRIPCPCIEEGQRYANRKGFYSLNVQVVATSQLRIANIVARWPGSTHDSRIFGESRVCREMQQGRFRGYHLLGDGGYPIKPYLMTPLLDLLSIISNS